jgi:hypothetical protein
MRSARVMTLTAGALVTAALLAGCGITDPYTGHQHASAASTATATTTNPDPAPEQGGTIPQAAQAVQGKLAAGAGAPTPQAALTRYATLYVNWTSQTVGSVQKQLAALSVGQARAQALQAAASYGRDTTLQQSHVANTGSVLAIAAGQGASSGSWIVVTRETTTGQGDYAGLPPTDHVTVAQLEHAPAGWVVSSWTPRS